MKENKLHKHGKQLVWLHWARLLFYGKDFDAVFYWALHLILNHCRVYWVLQSSFLVAGNLKSFSVGLGAKFLENDHCIHQPNLILGNSFMEDWVSGLSGRRAYQKRWLKYLSRTSCISSVGVTLVSAPSTAALCLKKYFVRHRNVNSLQMRFIFRSSTNSKIRIHQTCSISGGLWGGVAVGLT